MQAAFFVFQGKQCLGLCRRPTGRFNHSSEILMAKPVLFLLVLLVAANTNTVLAQKTYTISGTVKDSITRTTLAGATVSVGALNKVLSTDKAGAFTFTYAGAEKSITIKASHVGWNAKSISLPLETSSDKIEVEILLLQSNKNMGDVIVYAASRQAEKLTTAPAAISVVTPAQIEIASSHGLVGKTMEHQLGVDVVQSGANDFNINSRGFNASINRRMLVLVDGRDPSTPLINLNEWNSLSSLLGDVQSIEVVRGPGSALYGPNAYNGVVNIRTSDPKDILGTRITLMGGEWETYKGAIRHAGEFGDLSYKITLGASRQLNYSVVSRLLDSTKPNNGLEYAGIAHDVRPLTDEARRPYAYVGTARIDYNLDSLQRFVVEGGYSNSGNEFYVNQTGRILIQEVSRPFARLAYNSERFNVQAGWQQRYTPQAQVVYNARATSGEQSNVITIDAQWNDWMLDNKLRLIVGAQHDQQFVKTNIDYSTPAGETPLTFLDPDDQHGIFTGVYAQGEWQALTTLKVVGALRLDVSNIVETQLSPKLGLVFEPLTGQSFRLTYNRSFLRPSFADFYRMSPAGLPVNLAPVEQRVDSITSAIVGTDVQSNLGLGQTAQWNLGNPKLVPEKAHSIEIGYRGSLSERFFVEVNGYWNRRTDLISVPLGGLAPEVFPPVRSNTGNEQYNAVADSVLAAELAKINPNFPSRLSMYKNAAALVIAPTNIAVVDELGAELAATYFVTNELSISANYAYIDVTVKDNELKQQQILPNTSPHRINVGAEYIVPAAFDASIQLRYVEGFKWIAGLFEGFVPSYAVVNLNAGYFVLPELRLGVNVFNLLDRDHYEIFGGTILRRQVTGSITYTF